MAEFINPDPPYLNRGAYEWVPDDYGATSGSDFGVTQAYSSAVVDYGRPQNLLPPVSGFPQYANDTRIAGKGLIDVATGTAVPITDPTSITDPRCTPFLRLLMRYNRDTNSLPRPDVLTGVSFGTTLVGGKVVQPDAYFFFSTDHLPSGKLASVILEYALLVQSGTADDESPVDIYVVYEAANVGPWLTTAGVYGTGQTWGPPAQQVDASPTINGYLGEIAQKFSWGTLQAGPLKPWVRTGTVVDSSSLELAFTTSSLAGTPAALQVSERHSLDNIKTSGDYWSISDNYPRAKGILIAPSARRDLTKAWTMIVSGIRVYDAIMCNAVPAHVLNDKDIKAQIPCKVFGYAWRVNHEVFLMNEGTDAIQPGGLSRKPTFRFRLYHPDAPTLGVAHGVRFYYQLAVVPDPFSAAVQGGFSLVGTLAELGSGQAFMFVQFTGIWPGTSTLNFVPATRQYAPVGRVIYGGQFAYSRDTAAVQCFKMVGTGWKNIGASSFPNVNTNGVKPLWYDATGTLLDQYTFLAVNSSQATSVDTFTGGGTPLVSGAPRTDLSGPGAFSMPKTLSDSFSGTEKTKVYAKAAMATPAQLKGSVGTFCDANPTNHLATFLSDVLSLEVSQKDGAYTSLLSMYAGTWRVRFAASVDADSAMSTQIFYRVGVMPAAVAPETANGNSVWGLTDVKELRFPATGAETTISVGTPTFAEVLSSPGLSTTEETVDISWLVKGETGQKPVNFETPINLSIPGNLGNARLFLQVWAIAHPRSGGVLDPKTYLPYPVTTLSWGGSVESMFQTTITETRSGAILAQQDPSVLDYTEQNYTNLNMRGNGQKDIPSGVRPHRDYPLYQNVVDVNKDHLPATLSAHADLANSTISDSTLSIIGLSVSPKRDPYDDQAQTADFYVGSGGNNTTFVGGTAIPPQAVAVKLNWAVSRPQFDVDVVLSLYAVASDGFTMFELARSARTALNSGSSSVTINMDVAQNFRVPDPNSQLIMRIKLWPYRNAVAETPVDPNANLASTYNDSFRSLDISSFELTFGTGVPIIIGQTGSGNKDWFLGLPVCSARTFGSSDYTFVADKDALGTFYAPPNSTYILAGWMFSPFWFLDMPYGAVFEFQDQKSLSGSMMPEDQAQSVRIRTAVDTLPSMSLSSDRDAGSMQGLANIVVNDLTSGGNAASAGNRIRVIEYPDTDAAASISRAIERLVRVGEDYVIGSNAIIISLSKDDPFLRGASSQEHRPDRFLFYEENEFDSANQQASIAVLSTYGESTWYNPIGNSGDTGPTRVVLTNSMKLLHGALDPVSGRLYIAGYRSTDTKNPQHGGMIAMRDVVPKMIFGTNSAAAGPLRYIDGTLDTKLSSGPQPLTYRSDDPNTLGDGGTTLPALESFPAVILKDGKVYVFYTLLTRTETEAKRALGKVFCRISYNGGGYFTPLFPVADLGYNTARAAAVGDPNDDSFQIRHVSVMHDRYNDKLLLFYWADGKVFMKKLGDIIDPARATRRPAYSEETGGIPSALEMNTYLVAGNVDYLSVPGTTPVAKKATSGSGVEKWLETNWTMSNFYTTYNGRSTNFMYDSTRDVQAGGTQGSSTTPEAKDKKHFPTIFITKYTSESDVPAQRVAAYMSSQGRKISLFLLDSLSRLLHREITMVSDTVDPNASSTDSAVRGADHLAGPLTVVNPTRI